MSSLAGHDDGLGVTCEGLDIQKEDGAEDGDEQGQAEVADALGGRSRVVSALLAAPPR